MKIIKDEDEDDAPKTPTKKGDADSDDDDDEDVFFFFEFSTSQSRFESIFMKFLQNLHQFGKILSDFIFVANLKLKKRLYHIFFPQDFIYQISFCFCKSKKKTGSSQKGKEGIQEA